ncbi:hypothetical protein [Priestia koreensis]|uniref:hypothetical protein n=1 Tax=Priestia koreensis TaxID=284581 RepID=UPI0030162EC1
MNVERIKEAYGALYEIETSLKDIIEDKMSTEHGPLWRRKLREEGKKHFHDVVSFYHKYQCLNDLFTSEELHQMHQLIAIRNKVCHMRDLSNDEFRVLLYYKEIFCTAKCNSNY